MSRQTVRLVSIVAVLAMLGLVLAVAASAAPGPGTWTKITKPAGTLIYQATAGATNAVAIAGTTSPDVTSVDVDCIERYPQSLLSVTQMATNVPVTAGSFSVNATPLGLPSNCRLRAVPSGLDPNTSYLGSYSGPIFYSNFFSPLTPDGVNRVGYTVYGGQGSGFGSATGVDQCGVQGVLTITTPAMQLLGPIRSGLTCMFYLPYQNISPTGSPTASSIVVDGHNAYLPLGVYFLKNNYGVPISQTVMTTTLSRHANGDLHVTESGRLVRCSVDDTYPPSSGSCPSAVNTGVTFTRTMDVFRGAHQIRLRDSFRSTDGVKHSVHAQYQANISPASTGTQGYRIPGHGSAFATPTADQIISGLGTKAATLFVRSDIHAFEGDAEAETYGLTWSRAPSILRFSHTDVNAFAMPYSITVPAGRRGYVGFAVSEANTTSGTASVAALAVREMVAVPSIGSPKPGAVIHGHLTTVKGSAFLGANGLPTSVKVNGHAAKLTRVSSTRETYAVTFTETFARHKLTVVARDLAGNTRSRSIRVTNKP